MVILVQKNCSIGGQRLFFVFVFLLFINNFCLCLAIAPHKVGLKAWGKSSLFPYSLKVRFGSPKNGLQQIGRLKTKQGLQPLRYR